MSRESEIVTLLEADTALMAILTGGVYGYTTIRRSGITRADVPTAFDSAGFLNPCAVVKARASMPDTSIYDLKEQVVARRTMLEIWLYEDHDYTAIESAEQRVFELMQGHKFPGAWPASWNFTTAPMIDLGALNGASTKRVDYLIVDLLQRQPA